MISLVAISCDQFYVGMQKIDSNNATPLFPYAYPHLTSVPQQTRTFTILSRRRDPQPGELLYYCYPYDYD